MQSVLLQYFPPATSKAPAALASESVDGLDEDDIEMKPAEGSEPEKKKSKKKKIFERTLWMGCKKSNL